MGDTGPKPTMVGIWQVAGAEEAPLLSPTDQDPLRHLARFTAA